MEKIHFFSLICIIITTCEALSTRIRIFLKPNFFLNETSTLRPRNQWIRFFKTALQSGLGRPVHKIVPCKRIQHKLRLWIPRRGMIRIPGTGFQSLLEIRGFRIPIVSGIPHSLSRIPDSKAQDSGFHKPKFSDSPIPYMGRTRIRETKYAVSKM